MHKDDPVLVKAFGGMLGREGKRDKADGKKKDPPEYFDYVQKVEVDEPDKVKILDGDAADQVTPEEKALFKTFTECSSKEDDAGLFKIIEKQFYKDAQLDEGEASKCMDKEAYAAQMTKEKEESDQSSSVSGFFCYIGGCCAYPFSSSSAQQKLEAYAGNDDQIAATLKGLIPVAADNDCVKSFAKGVKDLQSSDPRVDRRRMKIQSEGEVWGAERTWGLSIGGAISWGGYAKTVSISFINANCGCGKWSDSAADYHTGQYHDADFQKLDERQKHYNTEWYCVQGDICKLPDKDGTCADGYQPCNNNGFIWSFSVGDQVQFDLDDVVTLGAKSLLAGPGVSLSVKSMFDIKSKQCMLASTKRDGSVFGKADWVGKGIKLSAGVTMTCANPECNFAEMEYCAASISVGIGHAHNWLDYVKLFFTAGFWGTVGVAWSLPEGEGIGHQFGGPIVWTALSSAEATQQQCDRTEYAMGPAIVKIIAEKAQKKGKEISYPIPWPCKRKTPTDFENKVPAFFADTAKAHTGSGTLGLEQHFVFHQETSAQEVNLAFGLPKTKKLLLTVTTFVTFSFFIFSYIMFPKGDKIDNVYEAII